MRTNGWPLALALGIVIAVFSACSFNFTTAHIRSLKVSKDEDGKKEATTFGPGEKVYVIADIGNNVGKVKVKFQVLYDDVEGKQAGTKLSGAEKTLDVEGSQPAIFWITLPSEGFANGRYKAEVTMFAENGDQKGQSTAAFTVEGFSASIETDGPSTASQEDDERMEKTSASDTAEDTGLPPAADDFANRDSSQGGGTLRVYKGAWFEIKYPAAFRVGPSQRSSSGQGYDSVFFTAPDGSVEFYVFSPQWNGEPGDIEIKASEVLVSQTSEKGHDINGDKTVRRVTVKARDNSYSRSFEDTEWDNNTRKVFGIKYRDQSAYNRHRQTYLTFKQSLTQFAD